MRSNSTSGIIRSSSNDNNNIRSIINNNSNTSRHHDRGSLVKFNYDENQSARRGSNLRSKILDVKNRKRSYGTLDDDIGEPISTSDIIGNFGLFQFLVLLFSGLREASVGYDAVVMSILLQPETVFFCKDENQQAVVNQMSDILSGGHNISLSNGTSQCFHQHDGTRCENWVFPHNINGRSSLIADWNLVCHRHWLVVFTESSYFLGLVTGNLVWGYCADRWGRRPSYLCAHLLALISGLATVIMPNVGLFSMARFLSAFGSISYNIIYSIQVEIIGTKYRAFSTTMNHLGWGIGVICVPLANHLFSDYHYIISMAPILTLIMFPCAFWLPESSRWLMAKGDFDKARQVLVKVAKFNGKTVESAMEKRIISLQNRVNKEKMIQQEANGGLNRKQPYKLLFSDPVLIRDTIALSSVSFLGHMFYYLLTINFAYMENLTIEANFIISGAGEWVSVVIGALLMRLFSRKTCMTVFLFLIGVTFILQTIIDSNIAPELNTAVIVTTNNAIGTLSALLLVFITLIVNQEIYPTVIRQTGSSIVNTLGEFGSTLAPMLLQLVRIMSPWKADLIYAIFCILGMIGVQFITRTDDLELMDA